LSQAENELNSIHTRLVNDGKEPTAKSIRDIFQGNDKSQIGLIQFFDKTIEQFEELPEYTTSTVKKYKTIRRHVIGYLEAYKISKIALSRIDLVFGDKLACVYFVCTLIFNLF
jgi:hypothetical protein